ncbi:SpoVG family protein [[Clostridium] fimetarium]|uniref:DNA-binding protein SpoVG, cell septation regulator n=1 Tax=[Clostridium] fimetarium TaxID=99656 RepID=A0A1I0NGW8_9FIRM|nr:SpoVG family protein [[Clostridium] fimetarium]SEW00539.1 DNA-binding protein SpoVG, cell septation regulator [[Clostridium] fimetarium]
MKYSIIVNDVKRNEGSLKGFAAVTFGESFKVTNIAIIQAADGRIFVSMPRYKTNQQNENGQDVYKDICNPITKEFREELYADIIDAYENKDGKNFVSGEKTVEMPEVTVSVTPYEREGSNMKALARVVLDDCFVINNVTVLEGRNENNFVAMPGYKTNQKDEQGKDIFRDICYPVTAEFRTKMFDALLVDYEKTVEKNVEQSKQEAQENMQNSTAKEQPSKDTPFR